MEMGRRYRRWATRLLGTTLVLAGSSMIVWTLGDPPRIDRGAPAYNVNRPTTSVSPEPPIRLADYAAVWTRRFQRPLVDIPRSIRKPEAKVVEPKVVAIPTVPPPNVKLNSIIWSQSSRLAVFADPAGKEIVCGVGEPVGDAVVKAIESTRVILIKEETEFPFQLATQKNSKSANPTPNPRK